MQMAALESQKDTNEHLKIQFMELQMEFQIKFFGKSEKLVSLSRRPTGC
uniref:Uncharacterized protein n=1 Tax=mine drainage metagenome TaxID=410659 RepID=E6QR17_9ZZZZ